MVSLATIANRAKSISNPFPAHKSNMPPELVPDDEDYASEEDSDFAPDAAPAQASDASSDEESEAEDEVKAKPKSAKRKRGQNEEAEDAGFENSGDEAIIEKGLKRQKKKGKKGKDGDDDEEEGGEGGLIKTRSMRAQECVFSIFVVRIYADILKLEKKKRRGPWPIQRQRPST
jgi:hypothetical protein